ncbi:hypothetical protein GCM10007304_26780 [Rhodococcoides trifolii]|uniref:DoxX family membrane protein n=1 Tax=Rhodococcoides trifolii TaxID=908250 RepID=A0A917D4G1_9NOCA|nr:DoxX family protein [Rhodococcus trifolii]GGG11376.1 hypothetical protein GCM10007304_26780 [Rhodococcus trifolii]
MIVRRVARPMLASIFIAGGIDALRNPTGRAKAAAPLIEKTQDALPNEVTEQVPTDPVTLVKINAAVQVGGGILLATGKAPRIASAALAGSLIPTTIAGHPFWEETDPAAKAAQRTQFFKNLSLLGGLLIAAVDTEGKPSLAWRGRKAAKVAQTAVVGALPLASSSDAGGHLADVSEVAGARARELAHVASERGAVLADVAQDRGSKLAEIAQERGSKWADLAAKRAAELAEVAGQRGSELAEVAGQRGSEFAEVAQGRGSKLAELAAERARTEGGELASSLADWKAKYGKKAKKQAKAAGKDAKKQFASARKDAKKQVKSGRKDAQKQLEVARKNAEKQLEAARKNAEKRAEDAKSQLDGKVGHWSL